MTGARSGTYRRLQRRVGRLLRNMPGGQFRRRRRALSGVNFRLGRASFESLESRHLLAVTLGVAPAQISEDLGTATVSALLSEPNLLGVTVSLSASGSATGGTDYLLTNSQIVIPAGALSGITTVSAIQDSLDEADETIVIDIAEVQNDVAAGIQTQTITLVDDDPPPTVTLSINDGTISENGGVATLTAALTAVSGLPVAIDLGFSGTALLGVDFNAPNQIVIPARSLIRSVAIASVQDELDELAETVVVQVTGVSNGSLSGAQQFLTTIVDDDPPPTVTLSVAGPAIVEADGQTEVTATLSQASGQAVTVDLSYSGTATAGTDYDAVSQIVIPSGSLTGAAAITALQDAVEEPPETVIVDIAAVDNATELGVQQAVVSILDDDTTPTVTMTTGTPTLVEGSAVELSFGLSFATGRDVILELGYAGTATAGSDYTPVTQFVISAGSTTSSLLLDTANDPIDEVNETIIVEILSVTNGFESEEQQVAVTIEDDDPAPHATLAIDDTEILEAGGVATLTVTLSAPSSFDVLVGLGYAGSARRGTDYSASSSQMLIPAGETQATATLRAIQDDVLEFDESIIVNIVVVANARELGRQ